MRIPPTHKRLHQITFTLLVIVLLAYLYLEVFKPDVLTGWEPFILIPLFLAEGIYSAPKFFRKDEKDEKSPTKG